MIVGEIYTREGQTRLRNMRHEASLPEGYVELVAMPSGNGPWAYDAQTQTAVPATLTPDERVDRLSVPARVAAALTVGALPAADTTNAEKTWARAILLDLRDRARAARA
jgi:hypothetical protein